MLTNLTTTELNENINYFFIDILFILHLSQKVTNLATKIKSEYITTYLV